MLEQSSPTKNRIHIKNWWLKFINCEEAYIKPNCYSISIMRIIKIIRIIRIIFIGTRMLSKNYVNFHTKNIKIKNFGLLYSKNIFLAYKTNRIYKYSIIIRPFHRKLNNQRYHKWLVLSNAYYIIVNLWPRYPFKQTYTPRSNTSIL